MRKGSAPAIGAMVAAAVLSLAARLPAADFEFGFRFAGASPCGGVLAVPMDADTAAVEVLLAITTRNNELSEGASGWAMGLEVMGAAFDPSTFAPVAPDSYPAGLDIPLEIVQGGTIHTKVVGTFAWATLAPAASVEEGGVGAVSSVILGMPVARSLLPEGAQAVARIALRIPLEGTPREVVLRYRDSVSQEVGAPVTNLVTLGGKSFLPVLGECRFEVARTSTAAFIRGDPNGDGRADISDAVWTVHHLVPAIDPARAYPIPCPASGDSNGDGKVNISDAVWLAGWLFLGGSPPPPPFPACGLDGGLAAGDCPPGSTGCP